MIASVSRWIPALMLAMEALLSASEDAGPTSAIWRGGGAGSGGPWLIQKRWGVPEVGRGMGAEITRRTWRQARSNSAFTSSAGRTATLPNTTLFGVFF